MHPPSRVWVCLFANLAHVKGREVLGERSYLLRVPTYDKQTSVSLCVERAGFERSPSLRARTVLSVVIGPKQHVLLADHVCHFLVLVEFVYSVLACMEYLHRQNSFVVLKSARSSRRSELRANKHRSR